MMISKILKSLNVTKKYNPLSQDSFRTKVLLESVKNNSMSTLRPEKRKLPHDASGNDTPSICTIRSPGGPLIQRRKFPGPAGILPDLGSSATESSVLKLQEKAAPVPVPQEVVCSQNSANDFTSGPWQQMLNDLELDQNNPKCPLEVFNIKWVLRRASLRGQAAVRKVPFLAVMLRNLDVTHVDAQALLKDKTGEMNATIASSVMEEYGAVLQTGSVLLLRGVTVLSPVGVRTTSREHLRKHYLNITLNTVVTIYTPDDSGNVVRTLISEVDKNELYNEAAAPKTAACSRAIVEEEEDEIMDMSLNNNQSLFSMNDSFARNLLHPNQVSLNQKQLPNYRSPKVGGNSSVQNYSPRVQSKNNLTLTASANGPKLQSGVSSVLPGITNSPQSRGFQFSQPRVSAPIMSRNYTARSERPQLRAQQPQNTSSSQSKPFFSFRPTGQQDATTASGRTSSGPCDFFLNSNMQIQETEEKEVRDLLNSVDAESLFGDF
ncbi:uncharacterized protein LOC125041857 isoform X2 [Penaeus chinensis]|uniref:uncharacterized protein LOC125041857 isoform X2 n=1 Tax=Penaeus chinensis TaxID=139456 RepID=UPI001FB61A9A|nr:uncharacterized protein LOC125041857 isoform X2 [Penaeus chinensis]